MDWCLQQNGPNPTVFLEDIRNSPWGGATICEQRGDVTKTIDVVESEKYKDVIVNGFVSRRQGVNFEFVIWSEKPELAETLAVNPPNIQKAHLKRTIECRLLMDPFQIKLLLRSVRNMIEEYEKIFGKIDLGDEAKALDEDFTIR